jgi:hypothetical protein
MVGWSGSGSLEDLERTVVHKLGEGAKASSLVSSLIIETGEPVAAARDLAHLPGVEWIGVGGRFNGADSYLKSLVSLGERYLPRAKTFKVSAQTRSTRQLPGDLILAGNSQLLSSFAGTRVQEKTPDVRFRVALEGSKGACAAEIVSGPGGAPSSPRWVVCLVSGGARSSAMAWLAALSGYSVRLLHSSTGEPALRQVARLYSELSHRLDPQCLELVLLTGETDPFGRIGRWLEESREEALAGLHPDRPEELARLAARFPNLAMPLLLFPADQIRTIYRSLEVGRPVDEGRQSGFKLEALERRAAYSILKLGGRRPTDANSVLDRIKRGV